MKKGHHRPAKIKFWRRHIKRCSSSGLLQKEYCAKHRLNKSSFGLWKRILADMDAPASLPSAPDAADPAEPHRLIPLSLLPDTANHSHEESARAGIQLHTAGYTIDLSVGFHVGTLQLLLAALG